MKSLITLLSAALLYVSNSTAQTNINGQTRNEANWNKTGEPGELVLNSDVKNDVTVYPNPFNNIISFDIKGGSVKEVSVYNVVGRKLASVTDAIVSKITISTVNYPSGIYIYKIQHSDNTITTGKLIKQ